MQTRVLISFLLCIVVVAHAASFPSANAGAPRFTRRPARHDEVRDNGPALTQITVETSPTTVLTGVKKDIGVNLHAPVPHGLELTFTATGSDGKAVSQTFKAGQQNTTLSVVPSIDLKEGEAPYTLSFDISGSAAGNYRKPPAVSLPALTHAQIVITSRGFAFLHTEETVEIPLYLAVPIPKNMGPLTIQLASTEPGVGPTVVTVQPVGPNGENNVWTYQNLTYTAGKTPGTYQFSISILNGGDAHYLPPPSWTYTILAPSPISLIGAVPTLAVGSSSRIEVVLGSPVPKGRELEFYVQADNSFLERVHFSEGEYIKSFVLRAGLIPGTFNIYFFLNLNASQYYIPPPPYCFILLPPSPAQIAVNAEPTVVFVGQPIELDVDLPRLVPKGLSIAVSASTNDKNVQPVEAAFEGEVSTRRITVTPQNAGVFTLTFDVAGAASAYYLPPPPVSYVVYKSDALLTLQGLATLLHVNEEREATVILGVPVPAGLTLTITLKIAGQPDNSVTVSDPSVLKTTLKQVAGSTTGVFPASFELSGTAAPYFHKPPAFNFVVVQNVAAF